MRYNNKVLEGEWSVTGYPLDFNSIEQTLDNENDLKRGPVVFEASFNVPTVGNTLETYLDTTGWGKVGYILLLV